MSNENYKPNVLVVCGRNKRRSRTAEFIFKNDSRLNIRSAGLSPKSERKLSEKDLQWADIVFVMEGGQREMVWDNYGHVVIPHIEVLEIPDDYEFMDEELIEILTAGMNDSLREHYNI